MARGVGGAMARGVGGAMARGVGGAMARGVGEANAKNPAGHWRSPAAAAATAYSWTVLEPPPCVVTAPIKPTCTTDGSAFAGSSDSLLLS
jgi:hypothetical protein